MAAKAAADAKEKEFIKNQELVAELMEKNAQLAKQVFELSQNGQEDEEELMEDHPART